LIRKCSEKFQIQLPGGIVSKSLALFHKEIKFLHHHSQFGAFKNQFHEARNNEKKKIWLDFHESDFTEIGAPQRFLREIDCEANGHVIVTDIYYLFSPPCYEYF
jgi:hypothetical protein